MYITIFINRIVHKITASKTYLVTTLRLAKPIVQVTVQKYAYKGRSANLVEVICCTLKGLFE